MGLVHAERFELAERLMGMEPLDLEDTARARWILQQSETALADILAAFELISERMLSGEDISLAEISKARVALGQVRSQLIDEVRKYEERILRDRGLVADAPIDFDELRDSIGSKLDRIREHRCET